METFPFHKHEEEKILPSLPMSLAAVLEILNAGFLHRAKMNRMAVEKTGEPASTHGRGAFLDED